MPAPQVRPFLRAAATWVADLVDLHVAAVAPGVFERGTTLEHLPPARAADRLRLCGVDRLVARGGRRPPALDLLTGADSREPTRTGRGWEHRLGRPQMPGR